MSASEPAFQPLEQLRAHELVAEQLRRQIALRLAPPGRALPPERALARLFGVGRATVQRAVALLEEEGLVERRRGRRGGTFVVGPVGGDHSMRRLIERLRRDRIRILEALDYRLEIEPAAAARAAAARTDADLAAIGEAFERATAASNDAEFMEHDTEFHLAIARATGNRFLAEAVERLRLLLNDAFIVLPDSALWRSQSNRQHALVRAAVAAADTDGARAAMESHVRSTDTSVRALLASL